MKKRPEKIKRGGESVFADLGFTRSEATELKIKAELTLQIYRRIKSLKLTQTQAGARLKLSQPDVSKLMNGRYTGFSTDRLIALLNALQVDIDIVLRPRRQSQSQRLGTVNVTQVADAA